jgi:hypothetical protein
MALAYGIGWDMSRKPTQRSSPTDPRDESKPQLAAEFLAEYGGRSVDWLKPGGTAAAISTGRILLGAGAHALEVAIAHTVSDHSPPKGEALRTLWKKRRSNRPSPVLLITLYRSREGELLAGVVGPTGDPSPIMDLSAAWVERTALAALNEPDRHAAVRTINRLLGSLKDQLVPGIINSGLFASYALRVEVPQRTDWAQAQTRAVPLLSRRGLPLLRSLGFHTAQQGSAMQVLTHNGAKRAIAVILDASDQFDRPSTRLGGTVTPVGRGLSDARKDNLDWLVVTRGTQLRLYSVEPDVGVGSKGQEATYTELDLALLSEDDAGYLSLLFAPEALAPGSSVHQILEASKVYATALVKRLRERVYVDMIPRLAVAIASRMDPAAENYLDEAYHHSIIVLFRLLFLAYAEDQGMLPFGRNPRYDRRAIKTVAKDFAADPEQMFDELGTGLWDDMLTLWKAVDESYHSWDVPAYNGGLFSPDPAVNPSGAALALMRLTDAEFGPALRALLIDVSEDGVPGPVDFRSLSAREFGTIYEGLLESKLSVAPTDLAINAEGSYVPAKRDSDTKVSAGQLYIHDQRGSRKSSGSYFTKPFAVRHLLDSALDPAIDAHLARVEALITGGNGDVAQELFDFRVADLSMGSGHFLVAAIDRIEAKVTSFLADHPIPALADELSHIAEAARNKLGEQAVGMEIEFGRVLRRQIARRCIYGLDTNRTAVELAKLAVWIHTAVPGLPMASLEHGLIVGNSLTGIATLDEVLDILDPNRQPGQTSLFRDQIEHTLRASDDALREVAKRPEITKPQVAEATKGYAKVLEKASDVNLLCDAAVAIRLGFMPLQVEPQEAIRAVCEAHVQIKLADVRPTHLPVRFPEVFTRDRPGFDVLLGNPPWDKVKVEAHQWWALRFPGLRSMSQQDKNNAMSLHKRERPDLVAEYEADVAKAENLKFTLGKGPFPGLRAGTDTDLSVAFAWRYWQLLRVHGRAGVVLPRGALSGRATVQWRGTVLHQGAFKDTTFLSNSRNWIFDDVHPQYTVALVSFTKGRTSSGHVALKGPYFSWTEYEDGMRRRPHRLDVHEFESWADGAPFPVLPRADSLSVFLKLRSHPRLDSSGGGWQFLPVRELHTTDNKAMFDFDLAYPQSNLPVLTGGSFHLWNPDFGEPYAYASSAEVIPWLQTRRRRQIRLTSGAFYGMHSEWAADTSTLPCMQPRIAFRDVARATDSRTVICSLVPGNVTLVHPAPYLLRRQGDAADEAYLLAVLSSVPLDWYARRYVDIHLTAGLLRSFPIPRPQKGNSLRNRAIEIAGRLAAVDNRYDEWAAAVGVAVGSVSDEGAQRVLVAELDAVVAHLYGLDRADVRHVFATFHRGWDYADRLSAVLRHYDQWALRTDGVA